MGLLFKDESKVERLGIYGDEENKQREIAENGTVNNN